MTMKRDDDPETRPGRRHINDPACRLVPSVESVRAVVSKRSAAEQSEHELVSDVEEIPIADDNTATIEENILL